MSHNPISNHEQRQKLDSLRPSKLVISLQPLYIAAKGGDLKKFKKALEEYSARGTDSKDDIISAKGLCGNSLLHFTAGIENAEILGYLLQVIEDKKLAAQPNNRGDTALHFAARASSIDTAKLLLDFCSDVDKPNKAGDWPLHEAVKNGHLKFTELLLIEGSKPVNKKNKEEKCPLYLAVETGNLDILLRLLQEVHDKNALSSWIEGMSPVHGAVMHQRKEMLMKMSDLRKRLFDLKGNSNDSPLHAAARNNYVEGVEFLVKNFASSAFDRNISHYFPIHVACEMGHLDTIKVLRQHWPEWLEPAQLLTSKTFQNILHVAAKHGRASIVKYILGDPKFEKLINAKDKNGDTPLHVATVNYEPEVLLFLTRDKRVNLELTNHEKLTAFDIVDDQPTEINASLDQRLTWIILASAEAFRSKDKVISQTRSSGLQRTPPEGKLEKYAEVRMIVATLIAGVTFAAGFSVPGGYNSSEPDAGIATLLNKPMYDVFVICNSIAMYSSIIVFVILLWTQINDSHIVFYALRMTRLPLLTALATMSMAFMAGVYVTISKRTWIAIITLIIGITALSVILVLYITLFIPLGYNSRLIQLFTDYIIRAVILIIRRGSVIKRTSKNNNDPRSKLCGGYLPLDVLCTTSKGGFSPSSPCTPSTPPSPSCPPPLPIRSSTPHELFSPHSPPRHEISEDPPSS